MTRARRSSYDAAVRFAHALVVRFRPGDDTRALGGAVTQALCGHWEHEGPCRWPHRTAASLQGDGSVRARVAFECEPADEAEVRRRIVDAALRGWLDGPEGRSEWIVEREGAADPDATTSDP